MKTIVTVILVRDLSKVHIFLKIDQTIFLGQCLENPGTAMPKRECYCPAGSFGKNCEKSSEITSNTYNASDYTEILLRGNDVKFLWRYVGNTQETLEGIIIAKTTSYVVSTCNLKIDKKIRCNYDEKLISCKFFTGHRLEGRKCFKRLPKVPRKR